MDQHICPVMTESTEEQSSEPPGTLRSAQMPSSPQTDIENETLGKKLNQWNDWRWQFRNRIRSLEQL